MRRRFFFLRVSKRTCGSAVFVVVHALYVALCDRSASYDVSFRQLFSYYDAVLSLLNETPFHMPPHSSTAIAKFTTTHVPWNSALR